MTLNRQAECARRLLERGVINPIVREAIEDLIDRAQIEEIVLNSECRAKIPSQCSNPEHRMKFKSSIERRRSRDEALMKEYRASKDHPSADDVASGKVSIKDALKKGFEAEFGGQRLVFFTKTLDTKYDGADAYDPKRLSLFAEALRSRKGFSIRHHKDEQVAFVQQGKSIMPGRPLVVIADEKTGVVQSLMRSTDKYVRRNFR